MSGRASTVTTIVSGCLLSALLALESAIAGGLPPVPFPPENPPREAKRILGKILFWEEQLSSDDTVACGTCHRPGFGSVDGRRGLHPGHDTVFGTKDDILGSPGVARMDEDGFYSLDPIFGAEPQVTGRNAQTAIGSQWSPELFWDGRAADAFIDPESGHTLIPTGGGLESQAIAPIMSDVEMAREGRTWSDIREKLTNVRPLELASDLPPDMRDAIESDPSYPELFAAAFGESAISASRIAFALATYERTLVPDQTPVDRYWAGQPNALTENQRLGLIFFQSSVCAACHQLPLFTDHSFRNIGLRPGSDDRGREDVTGDPDDRGSFKVPSLRNVGLRDRLMHTGQVESVLDAVRFYQGEGHTHFTDNQDPLVLGGILVRKEDEGPLVDFLSNGLTDSRVAAELYPFDRPTLRSERAADVSPGPSPIQRIVAAPNPFRESVSITFRGETNGPVSVKIFETTGRLVEDLTSFAQTGANGTVLWDGTDENGNPVAAGHYLVLLETPTQSFRSRILRID